MEAEYCPFTASGEAAQKQHQAAHTKAADPAGGAEGAPPGARQVMRKMTRSNISEEHKGVLTVTLVGANGLRVRLLWR